MIRMCSKNVAPSLVCGLALALAARPCDAQIKQALPTTPPAPGPTAPPPGAERSCDSCRQLRLARKESDKSIAGEPAFPSWRFRSP